MAPEGVSVHFNRLEFPPVEPKRYEAMLQDLPSATRGLSYHKPDAIASARTTGSAYRGFGHDRELIAEIESIAAMPCSAAISAVVAALREIGGQNAWPWPRPTKSGRTRS